MKKIIFLILIFFTTVLNVQAEEIKRITVGNKDAKRIAPGGWGGRYDFLAAFLGSCWRCFSLMSTFFGRPFSNAFWDGIRYRFGPDF